MNEELDSSATEGHEYDDWFKTECLPFLQDKSVLTLKHVEKLATGKTVGNPDYFASSTAHNCLILAADLSYSLVVDEHSPLIIKRQSLLNLILLWPIYYFIRSAAKNIDVAGIISKNEDDLFSLVSQIGLYESFVFHLNREIFSIGFDFLAASVVKTSIFMGLESRPDMFTEESILHCIEEMKAELKRRSETVPED